MEPLTPAIVAVATLILKKTFEKTGEKLGEAVSSQAAQLMQLVKRKLLPKTTAIAQAEQPVDFGQAVLEVETVASTDPELAQAVNQLAESVNADPKLLETIQTTIQSVQSDPTLIQNNAKLAEKIGMVVQGGTVNVENMSF